MAQLIAPTTAAVTSADQVLAANSSTMFSLTGTTQPYGVVRIEKKGSDGSYVPMAGGVLTAATPQLVLPVYANAITVRVIKDVSAGATGVDMD